MDPSWGISAESSGVQLSVMIKEVNNLRYLEQGLKIFICFPNIPFCRLRIEYAACIFRIVIISKCSYCYVWFGKAVSFFSSTVIIFLYKLYFVFLFFIFFCLILNNRKIKKDICYNQISWFVKLKSNLLWGLNLLRRVWLLCIIGPTQRVGFYFTKTKDAFCAENDSCR